MLASVFSSCASRSKDFLCESGWRLQSSLANSLLICACREKFLIRSARDLFVILSVLAKTSSRLPNLLINSIAVASPIPGTPGMLSLVSPAKAIISTILSGVTPNLFFTQPSSIIKLSLFGLITFTLPLTTCNISLSAVTIMISNASPDNCLTNVAIISSASYPFFSNIAILYA